MKDVFNQLPHPGIQQLMPYKPGKSIDELKNEQGLTNIIKLASNENPLGCSLNVQKALAALPVEKIASYPLSVHHALRQQLAKKLAVPPSMIVLANGSDSLFLLLQTTFALHTGKSVLTHENAFIAYSVFAKTLGIPIHHVPLTPQWQLKIDDIITACSTKTALIFLANPGNPIPVTVSRADIQHVLNHIPKNTLLVIDEAYHEYVSDELESALSLLKTHQNLVITRTFSKAYGLAGLRLGYAIADESIIAYLLKIMPPFSVNQAALTAGLAALEDDDFLKQSIESNKKGLIQLQQGLRRLSLPFIPPFGNFLTFDCKQNAEPLYEAFLRQGLIVRALQGYPLPQFLRVTVGTSAQNHYFLDTLSNLITNKRD